ncbi:MAG: hypothetical protein ACO3BD_03185, partial [Chitinophagaceae bacterium]
AKASTTRTQSGASYYGIMELSGNLWEQVITIGRQTSTSPNSILGRNYTGTHGNGTLSSNGSANSSSWPTTSGHGRRGGSFDRSTSDASISSRILGIGVPDFINSRAFTDGFRGVRTAPN